MNREAGKGILAGLGIAATVGILMLIPHQTQAQFASPVRVANTNAQPVPTQNRDDPGRAPYTFNGTALFTAASNQASTGDTIVVPAGQVLVIDYVSAACSTSTTATIPSLTYFGPPNLGFGAVFPLFSQGTFTNSTVYIGGTQTTMFVPAGRSFAMGFEQTLLVVGTQCTANASGHFITLP